MELRQLGAGGPMVPALGIGAMSFSNFYGPVDEAASHAVLDTARDLGITHIDTANVYGMGQSETFIGSYLAKNPDWAPVIATKASITRDPETGERYFNNALDHLTDELEASLKRLGRDHVDLFYIHRRDTRFEIEEVSEALAKIVASGKARATGFSEIAPTSLARAAAVHPVAAVQSEYSLSTRAPDLGLVQACAKADVALVAFSPVGRGLLTDTPPDAERVADLAFLNTNPRFTGGNLERNLAATAPFRALAADLGLTAAGLAIAWVMSRGDHVIPIPGTRSPAHLRALAAGAERRLTEDELAAIDAILPVGWAHGDRYSAAQWIGPERYG